MHSIFVSIIDYSYQLTCWFFRFVVLVYLDFVN